RRASSPANKNKQERSKSSGQRRPLAEAALQVTIQLAVDREVSIVKRGRLLIRLDRRGALDASLRGLGDIAPDAGSDAGQNRNAIGGTFRGVGQDDRQVVDICLQLTPERAASPAARGSDFGHRDL